jgi:ATP-dependent Lon protease
MADNEMLEAQQEVVTDEVQDTPEVGKDGSPFDAERAQALIDKLREENKAAKSAAKELAELKAADEKRKEAEMSELEKLQKKAAELETKLRATELREMRNRIGTEHKLPAEIAELLQGETEEAMKAHAAKLALALPKPSALTPTNPGNKPADMTDAQRRAFLYGGGSMPT